MPPLTSEQSLIDTLIALKSQYERLLTEAETQASHFREQLLHVNALLLNQLVPTKAPIKSAEPALTLAETDAQVERLALAPAATEAPANDTPKPKAAAGKRSPRPLLRVYDGLTRLEAIAQVLQQYPGEVLHQDTIIQALYGDLSLEELKDERVRIKTALLTGVKDGKWQKASVPSSYFLGDVAADAEPKHPGRKPKEPIPQPDPVETIAPALAQTVATKVTAAKPKPGRKPAVAKVKASKSKRTEAELLEILQKADIHL